MWYPFSLIEIIIKWLQLCICFLLCRLTGGPFCWSSSHCLEWWAAPSASAAANWTPETWSNVSDLSSSSLLGKQAPSQWRTNSFLLIYQGHIEEITFLSTFSPPPEGLLFAGAHCLACLFVNWYASVISCLPYLVCCNACVVEKSAVVVNCLSAPQRGHILKHYIYIYAVCCFWLQHPRCCIWTWVLSSAVMNIQVSITLRL